MAFWAPFLLLHLGGLDSITAYSLQDSELGRRHLLGLVIQVGAAGCVSKVLDRNWTHFSVHSNVYCWNDQVWREDLGSQVCKQQAIQRLLAPTP